MAYFIFINNQLTALAANDSAKSALNVSDSSKSEKSILDEDFVKVKTNTFSVSLSGDTVNLTDLSESLEGSSIDENSLKPYHQDIINLITELESNDPTNVMLSECTAYKNYLKNLDYSSLSLPLTKPWEKYCEDNSITYLHPLQIP